MSTVITRQQRIVYDDGPTRWFIAASMAFGVVGKIGRASCRERV